jgi:DNA-binding NtrC family response regulator
MNSRTETAEHVPSASADAWARPLCASVLVDGHTFVVELPPRGLVVLGRDAECDLQLGTVSVSRQHARLDVRGDEARLVDLASRNGTYLDGERIAPQEPRHVGRGDEIALGSVRLALVTGALVPTAAPRVLVRSALLSRIDADLGRGRALEALALRLPSAWYEHADVVRWLATLGSDTYVGMVGENALVAIATAPIARHPSARVGRARSADHRSATALVVAAVRAASAGDGGTAPRRSPGSPVFESAAMRRVEQEATQIAPSGVSVLLVGETGVGKEVFARLIHERSGRKGPLVSVNTAAIPDALVESELFGHERGAFSGAHQAKVGLIEAANKGSLFLDEIGDLGLPLQAKLLRVLEDRAVRPVGSTQERKVDIRVVAATSVDLDRAVESGAFRRDLFFRLNACTLHIPPLRERRDDIEPLAAELLGAASGDDRGVSGITLAPETLALLRAYDWPGNVRELRNVVERGVAIAGAATALLPEHLPAFVRTPASGPSSAPPGAPNGDGVDVRGALKSYERQRILDALDQTSGNRTEAAKVLGLPRRTLSYKMQKLGLGRA